VAVDGRPLDGLQKQKKRRFVIMKHIKALSHKPAQAQDASIGQILAVVAAVLGVLGEALIAKDTPPTLPTS
jgi:hypothetical protein